MTIDEMHALMDIVADVMKEYVAKTEAPLLARIKALEAEAVMAADVGTRIKALEALAPVPGPAGERGPEGPAGVAGRDGRDAPPAAPGEKGADGVNGKDGLDGKDGLGFDDLDVVHDGERGITITFKHGDRVKAFPLTIPCQIYRGVYQAGQAYAKGDGVTWGGSMWVAKEATTEKPGDGPTGWVMAVKTGRDGKPGPEGKTGPAGPRGEKGEVIAKW